MKGNYFFIDGSALVAQIKTLQKTDPVYSGRKLDPQTFIHYFMNNLDDLDLGEFKRAVFYFPVGDKIPRDYIVFPSFDTPGTVRDIHFKECGEKLKAHAAFSRFLDSVPIRWQDRCTKSEKGIDIEICCDALKLAFTGKLERLVLLTNDRDFLPLCKTLKDFGVNISLIHLSGHTNVNKLLVSQCDTYDVVETNSLNSMFRPHKEEYIVEKIPPQKLEGDA